MLVKDYKELYRQSDFQAFDVWRRINNALITYDGRMLAQTYYGEGHRERARQRQEELRRQAHAMPVERRA